MMSNERSLISASGNDNTMVQPVKVLQVGDIIQTNESFGPNPANSIGVVYETYADTDAQPRPVVSVLLTNGHDIGSFTANDQDESLTWLGRVDLDYTYVSPSRLMQDFREGYFRQVFAAAMKINQQQSGGVTVAE